MRLHGLFSLTLSNAPEAICVSTQFLNDLNLDATDNLMMKISCEFIFIGFKLNCKLILGLILNFIYFNVRCYCLIVYLLKMNRHRITHKGTKTVQELLRLQ